MSSQRKPIRVHKLLRMLFGAYTTRVDVLAILAGSFTLSIFVLVQLTESMLSPWLIALLLLLALDLGGGVVANFTSGTKSYYAEKRSRQFAFLAFHVLQPLIIAGIFPGVWSPVLIVAGLILLSSLLVVKLTDSHLQRVIAALLFLICATLISLLNFDGNTVRFLMLVFAAKLILAFSVGQIDPKRN